MSAVPYINITNIRDECEHANWAFCNWNKMACHLATNFLNTGVPLPRERVEFEGRMYDTHLELVRHLAHSTHLTAHGTRHGWMCALLERENARVTAMQIAAQNRRIHELELELKNLRANKKPVAAAPAPALHVQIAEPAPVDPANHVEGFCSAIYLRQNGLPTKCCERTAYMSNLCAACRGHPFTLLKEVKQIAPAPAPEPAPAPTPAALPSGAWSGKKLPVEAEVKKPEPEPEFKTFVAANREKLLQKQMWGRAQQEAKRAEEAAAKALALKNTQSTGAWGDEDDADDIISTPFGQAIKQTV